MIKSKVTMHTFDGLLGTEYRCPIHGWTRREKVLIVNLKLSEYEICQRRGHETNGTGTTQGYGPTWMYCKWCGCKFRHTDPEEVEHPEDEEAFGELRLETIRTKIEEIDVGRNLSD